MKRRIIMVCIVMLVVSCFVFIAVAQTNMEKEKTTISKKVRWEYMIYPSNGRLSFDIDQGNNSTTKENFVKAMNKLGAEGWEIIQVGSFVVLKRLIPIPPSQQNE